MVDVPPPPPSSWAPAPPPAPQVTSGQRPVRALLIAAAAVAVVTVGLVLRFGLVPPPPLEPVDATTRPTRSLALLSFREAADGQCLDVVAPDGMVREVRCGLDGVSLVGWDDRGVLVVRFAPAGQRVEAIDPADGTTRVLPDEQARSVLERGGWVDSERDGAVLVVRDAEGRTVWRVEAPDNYRVTAMATDASSGTVALLDAAGRILVLPADATVPSVWVDDVHNDFGELMWEGTPVGGD